MSNTAKASINDPAAQTKTPSQGKTATGEVVLRSFRKKLAWHDIEAIAAPVNTFCIQNICTQIIFPIPAL